VGDVHHFVESQIAGFKFPKRRQLFIRSHNETVSIAAMRVSNKFVRVD
jgi:hypothetical protein